MKRLGPDFAVEHFSAMRLTLAAFLGLVLIANCPAAQPDLPPPSKANAARWEKDIAKFEAGDRLNPPPQNGILFIGSSSIRLWKTLAEDFPGLPVFNRGFGGSQIADSLHFADRIVIPYHPRQIVMFAGSNDINAKKSPQQVFTDFVAFRERVRRELPKTRITYIAITPCESRWKQLAQVDETNGLIAAYCAEDSLLDFVDTRSDILGQDGHPRKELFRDDQLHLSPKGYEIWTSRVRPFLK
jgi:lysophospholipase L1-like esterase